MKEIFNDINCIIAAPMSQEKFFNDFSNYVAVNLPNLTVYDAMEFEINGNEVDKFAVAQIRAAIRDLEKACGFQHKDIYIIPCTCENELCYTAYPVVE